MLATLLTAGNSKRKDTVSSIIALSPVYNM